MNVPQALIDRYFNGECTPSEFEQLSIWIKAEPMHAEEFMRQCALHAHLWTFLDSRLDPLCGDETREAQTQKPVPLDNLKLLVRPTPFSLTVATVVIGILIMAMAYSAVPWYRGQARGPKKTPVITVARITGMNNVRWGKQDIGRELKSYLLAAEPIEMQDGLLEVTFNSKATIVVRGPTKFSLGPNALNLEFGQVAAKVPDSAHGFAVNTAAATFIDLGTEFVVNVEPSRSSTMFVQQGRVSYQTSRNKTPVVLGVGEGVEIRPSGETLALSEIPRTLAMLPRDIRRENLVRNGNFQKAVVDDLLPREVSKSQANWHSRGTTDAMIARESATSQNLFVQFTGDPLGGASIEQQIRTEPGTEYWLRFRLARNMARNTPTIQVMVVASEANQDAEPTATTLVERSYVIDWPMFEWRTISLRFVAVSESTTIRFTEPATSVSHSVGPLLDDVRVLAAGVRSESEEETPH